MKKLLIVGLITSLNLCMHSQNINFNDPNFKNSLLNHNPAIDLNRDGQISIQEAENLNKLNLNHNISGSENLKISNLNEITYFKNLTELDIAGNKLRSLDITKLRKLKVLKAENNQLTTLNSSNNLELENLYLIGNSSFESIDLTNNVNLYKLYIGGNSSSFAGGRLISDRVVVPPIPLNEINLANNNKITDLKITNTSIQFLDVSNLPLEFFSVEESPYLRVLYAKHKGSNSVNGTIQFGYSPQLTIMCVHEDDIARFKRQIEIKFPNSPGRYANKPNFISNCGNDNVISGTVKYDSNNNGCDTDDISFSNLKFLVSSNTGTQQIFPSKNGIYGEIISNGNYNILPLLENPSYFSITPNISFPGIPLTLSGTGKNLVNDFCVTSKGNFNDLEISIIPEKSPKPGFTSTYTIIYKNIGTTTQSGTVELDYFQDLLTGSGVPRPSSTSPNKFTWNFSNLKPLESKEIEVRLELNKPTDNPAVNSGDVLQYVAKINGAIDEKPTNNTAYLNETVVNSFDPNDKICLEGDVIDITDVGKYIHYMIRFENTGTDGAANVTIKDQIDTSKLDISTFTPMGGSHEYSVHINDNKEIEFNFNNINLPFDDANNDGYVLFKIKTKDNLVVGNFINNKAAIYFDFNIPIITETNTVSIKEFKNSRNTYFDKYFALSQNPTKGKITLITKDPNIIIEKVIITDLGDNIVGLFTGNNTKTYDLSYLFPNIHFMTINCNMGTFTVPFVKID